MSTIQTIPFSRLIAADAINARAASKDGIDELAASIAAKGLIQALAVRPADSGDKFEVIDGRRRHQALAQLIKAKTLKKDMGVPCVVRNEDDAEALETSLMANTVRLPMHAVDQHEVFARLADGGQTPVEIAARFGLAERTVRQHLALGRLAEPVRKAWRKGSIDAKTAQAFAVHPDPAVQAATLERLGRRCDEWSVRNALAETRQKLDRCNEMGLIGEAAYLAAGGTLTDDLFEDARYVDDVALAKKLARDVVMAECARLKAAGWAWAAFTEDDDAPASWDCEHVRATEDDDGDENLAPEAYTAEERARAGCLVSIGMSGKGVARLDVATGLILPDGQTDLEDFTDLDDDAVHSHAPDELPSVSAFAGDDPEAAASDDADGPWDISGALLESITTAQTVAAAAVLGRDPSLALAVAVAALTSSPYATPARLHVGDTALGLPIRNGDFAASLFGYVQDTDGDNLARLARIVAMSLTLRAVNGKAHRHEHRALVETLSPDDYASEMRRAFSAADYFARARKATAIAALEEMHDGGHYFGLMGRADLDGMKKAALAEWATEQATACGWLPPQLRHPAYALAPTQKVQVRA